MNRLRFESVKATLECDRSRRYPDEALSSVSLSVDGGRASELLPTLRERAAALKGEEAVFELTRIVSDYVEKLHVKKHSTTTLHDEMLKREEKERLDAAARMASAVGEEARRRRASEQAAVPLFLN